MRGGDRRHMYGGQTHQTTTGWGMRLERVLLAPEATSLSTELWGQGGNDLTT
jgi:hypothetical protein